MIAVRDLQIGDFINTENNGVVQITVLSWRGVGYEGGASTPEHCSYIPLTEDILVKNGFEKGKTIRGTELFCCEVTHQLAGDGFEIQRITIYPNWVVYAETATGIVRLGIKYVHQLQRLLNLCNIDKEIIL